MMRGFEPHCLQKKLASKYKKGGHPNSFFIVPDKLNNFVIYIYFSPETDLDVLPLTILMDTIETKHTWTEPELVVICSICQLTCDIDERIRMICLLFPQHSLSSVERIIDKYNALIIIRKCGCCSCVIN